MRVRFALLALASLLLLPASGRAEPVETRYREEAAAFHKLNARPGAPAEQWRELATGFYDIFREHITHPRGADGLYSSGLALRAAHLQSKAEGDLELALQHFQQFLRTYPDHRLADDSLMHIGEIFSTGGRNTQRAYLTFRQVLVTYPNGDQATLAKRKAAALEDKAAPLEDRAAQARTAGKPAQAAARSSGDSAGAAKRRKATVKRVLYSTLEDYTRVILTTDDAVSYRYSELPSAKGRPRRLYIDLDNALPSRGLATEHAVGDAVLDKIRISRNTERTTRVVFDLKEMERFEVQNLALPFEKKIIVDLYPKTHRPSVRNVSFTPAAPAARAARPRKSRPPSLRDALSLKVKKLVIDPGHGGRDPGAMGFGLKEKDVALQLSRELKAVFEANRPDIQVALTRNSDVFLPLDKRPLIAKRQGADLFVSIHLNAHDQERFHGVETYFLNLSTDDSSLRVAARENATTEKQITDLNAILRDLLQDTNILESGKLAKLLQASLVTELRSNYRVRDLGVKQAPFMVLIGAEMPSVLVEAGFLTNRRESGRLRKRTYLRRIAEGIYEGLRKYIQKQKLALDNTRPPRTKPGQDS